MSQTMQIVGQEKAASLIELSALTLNEAVLLIGETGTGKTTLIKNVAEKHGKDWIRFNLTGDTSVDEFVGKYTLEAGETKWQDGILSQAMKKGSWLIVDEINAALPEILFVLQSLLDDDRSITLANFDGSVLKPHPDFRFFATMNPPDEYAGTKELNKALKSRFGAIVTVATPPPKVEAKIIADRTELTGRDAAKMVLVATKLREMKDARKIYLTVSTRDLLQWAKLAHHTDFAQGFVVTILNKCDDKEERDLILKTVKNLLAELAEVEQELGGKEIPLSMEDLENLRQELISVHYQQQVQQQSQGQPQEQPQEESNWQLSSHAAAINRTYLSNPLSDALVRRLQDNIQKAKTLEELDAARQKMLDYMTTHAPSVEEIASAAKPKAPKKSKRGKEEKINKALDKTKKEIEKALKKTVGNGAGWAEFEVTVESKEPENVSGSSLDIVSIS